MFGGLRTALNDVFEVQTEPSVLLRKFFDLAIVLAFTPVFFASFAIPAGLRHAPPPRWRGGCVGAGWGRTIAASAESLPIMESILSGALTFDQRRADQTAGVSAADRIQWAEPPGIWQGNCFYGY